MARIEILARPGSSADGLDWDPWRKRWAVSCRAPPERGRANGAIRVLVAGWLDLPLEQVRWVAAGRSRFKIVEVATLSDSEIHHRLSEACAHRLKSAGEVRTPGELPDR